MENVSLTPYKLQPCFNYRAPGKIRKLTSIDTTNVTSSPNPMFDHLLKSS